MKNEYTHTAGKSSKVPPSSTWYHSLNNLGYCISLCLLVCIVLSFTVPDFSESGSQGFGGNIQLTHKDSGGEQKSFLLARSERTDSPEAKSTSTPRGELDLDQLARAVAQHETAGCTKGVGATHNNCHGLKENGEFIRFPTPGSSYHSFKLNWLKHYGNHFPTIEDAIKYSGNDRPEAWLRNVTRFYLK